MAQDTKPDSSKHRSITVDGNEAAASVAYRLSESIAIYPITPASGILEVLGVVEGEVGHR